MNKPTDIINLTGNYESSISQMAEHLGKNKIRRQVLRNMYGRHTKPRSKNQIMKDAGISSDKSQQVQNALGFLEKHHFIQKVENDGQTDDGSRWLYKKVNSLRGHIAKIEILADDKDKREALRTRALPAVPSSPTRRRSTPSRLKKLKRLTVLFLSSNPVPSSNLRTDVEFKRVLTAIRGSRYRDSVRLEHRPAADVQSILDALNDLRPEVVHFSGHGDQDGIYLDNNQIPRYASDELDDFSTHTDYEFIAKALKATDFSPKLVVLNSCLSSFGAEKLGEFAGAVISMDLPISDVAASVFSPQLYSALASGQSLQAAFLQALLAVETAVIDDIEIPRLWAADEIGAKALV